MRVVVAVTLAILAGLAPGAARAADWAARDERAVVRAGLLSDGRWERPLSLAELRGARDALSSETQVKGAGRLSVTAFEAFLVRHLGVADVAGGVQAAARDAGLRPPPRFGVEVVARALGLRFNHPWPRDERLEPYPWEPISRAEAAYSLARVIEMDGSEAQALHETFAGFVLPRYTARQRAALRVAVSKIGMPYIWGGETDTASSFFGGQARGGYDCSGLAWRVFRLTGLTRAIRGRVADDQAHEFPRARRVRFSALRPADLVFFGKKGYASHMGIALGANFMIHASAQGVYVSSLLEPWRRRAYLWGRRVV